MEKKTRISAIVKERGLSVKGFRKAMRALAKEYGEDFYDIFGNCGVVPAAYKVRRDGEMRRRWNTSKSKSSCLTRKCRTASW